MMAMSKSSQLRPLTGSASNASLIGIVQNNDLEAIENHKAKLLDYKDPYTKKNSLMLACESKKVDTSTVQKLIELCVKVEETPKCKRLDINATDAFGNTALLALIKSDDIDGSEEKFAKHVELLLDAGVDVNKSDSKGFSAILWAARKGYKLLVKTIVRTRWDDVDLDNHKWNGKSAKDLIIEKNLDEGELPPKHDQSVQDYFFTLIKQRNEDEFIRNCDKFANVDLDESDGTATPLQYACEKGLSEVVKYLLKNGADVNKSTENNPKSPLELATEHSYDEILKLLFTSKTKLTISVESLRFLVKYLDKPRMEKCLEVILENSEKISTSICEVVNDEDDLGNTFLHYSMRYGSAAITQKFRTFGGSLDIKIKLGFMPIEDIKPEVSKGHLDECVGISYKDNSLVDLDYRTLVADSEICSESNTADEQIPKAVQLTYASVSPPPGFETCKRRRMSNYDNMIKVAQKQC